VRELAGHKQMGLDLEKVLILTDLYWLFLMLLTDSVKLQMEKPLLTIEIQSLLGYFKQPSEVTLRPLLFVPLPLHS
jgi:hypothetical protein